MRRREFILLLAGGITTPPFATRAQTPGKYPDHPITLIVPYAPGGGNDVMARAVAEPMGKWLGQPVVIENVAGPAAQSARVRSPRPRPMATPSGSEAQAHSPSIPLFIQMLATIRAGISPRSA